MNRNWFSHVKINDEIYAIREQLKLLEPRFLTDYTNLYAINLDKSVIVIDTGSGHSSLKSYLDVIIKNIKLKELNVFNTHHHFDHVGNNYEFDRVHIHKLDYKAVSRNIDVSFLKESDQVEALEFKKFNYKLPLTNEMIPLVGDEIFEIDDSKLEVVYTPGHTTGSSCFVFDESYLFTGDTVHYGAYYLPEIYYWDDLIHSLENLDKKVHEYNLTILPGHEDVKIDKVVFQELINYIENQDVLLENSQYNEYLEAYVSQQDKFLFVYPPVEGY